MTTDKAIKLLNSEVINKKDLSEELGISRPSLDKKLSSKNKWKKLEVFWINKLYKEKL